MRVTLWIVGIITGIVILWNLTAYRDIDELKETAPAFIESKGFYDLEYVGYNGCPFIGGSLYYIASSKEDDYLYTMKVYNWRGEQMIGYLECMNAVSNSTNE